MATTEPTLESVRGDLDRLRETARSVYEQHPTPPEVEDGWSLEDYLAGIDELENAIDRALELPANTQQRYEAEKYARNVVANRLYFRGRLCLKTGAIGRFHKKIGERTIDWAPTELSRMADRLACEPLRLAYKKTERLKARSDR